MQVLRHPSPALLYHSLWGVHRPSKGVLTPSLVSEALLLRRGI